MRAATEPGNGGGDRLLVVLEKIDARLARLEAASERLERLEAKLPAAVAMVTDTFDSLVERAAAEGFDLDQRLRVLVRAVDMLTSPAAIAALEAILTSGMLDGTAVATLGKVGSALATVSGNETTPVGVLGLLRALRQPDVQRALGFGLAIARELGRYLDGHRLRDASGAPALPEVTP